MSRRIILNSRWAFTRNGPPSTRSSTFGPPAQLQHDISFQFHLIHNSNVFMGIKYMETLPLNVNLRLSLKNTTNGQILKKLEHCPLIQRENINSRGLFYYIDFYYFRNSPAEDVDTFEIECQASYCEDELKVPAVNGGLALTCSSVGTLQGLCEDALCDNLLLSSGTVLSLLQRTISISTSKLNRKCRTFIEANKEEILHSAEWTQLESEAKSFTEKILALEPDLVMHFELHQIEE